MGEILNAYKNVHFVSIPFKLVTYTEETDLTSSAVSMAP